MLRCRAIRRLRACCRSLLAVATLCGLLIGTVGFTVTPMGRAGAAFPCQGGTCGCRSASDCWLGCCCLTPAQRLAWAKANGVTPPTELLRLVADEEPDETPVASCCSGHAKKSCCSKGEPETVCRHAESPKISGFSSKSENDSAGKTADCCAKEPAKVASKEKSSDSSTSGFHPSRCRGPGHWWVAGGQPLAMPERPDAATLPTGNEPVLIRVANYALDAESPPTRPG